MFSNLSDLGAMDVADPKWVPAKKRDMPRSHGWTSSSHGVRKVGFTEHFVV